MNRRLDPTVADRLLRGQLGPDDAPPGLEGVVGVLRAARGPLPEVDSERAGRTVATMAAALSASSLAASPLADGSLADGSLGRRRSRSPKLAAGALAGVVSLFGGLAAAGALPGPAQDRVSSMLHSAGIEVPKGHGHGHAGADARHRLGGHPSGGPSAPPSTSPGSQPNGGPTAGATVTPPPCPPGTESHGDYVSSVAHSSTTVAPTHGNNSHGAVVSAAARSDCGKATTSSTASANAQSPVTTTNPAHEHETEAPKGPPPDGGDGSGQGSGPPADRGRANPNRP